MTFKLCYRCMQELPTSGGVCPHCGYDNQKDPLRQPSHVLPCGTILENRYVIGRSLGQGGFGITYIGFDLKLELRVCIKEYYPEGAAMRSSSQNCTVYWGTSENSQTLRDSRTSFVKEARKAVKLRDLGHVVKVWDVFYDNETAYIVMDYVEGETLKSHLFKTRQVLSEKECFKLLAPVIQDLEEVHARGIIHRDIKPDNLMRTPDGKLTLLDLGAAKDLGVVVQTGTVSSMMVVSQGFSPIEQYSRSGSIGPWTDVYAMCATMYYCLTGKLVPPPIERIGGQSVDLSAVSPKLKAVLEKGLEIKPEDRIRSMAELLKALKAAVGATDEVDPPPSSPLKWIALALAVVALCAAAVYYITTQSKPKEIVRTLEKANAVEEVLNASSSMSDDEKQLLDQLAALIQEGASIHNDDSNYYVLSLLNSTGHSFEDVTFQLIFYDDAGSILYAGSSTVGLWGKGENATPRMYASSNKVASARLRIKYDYNGKHFETEYLDIPCEEAPDSDVTLVLKKALPATFNSKTYYGSFQYEISSFSYDASAYKKNNYTLTMRFGGKVLSAESERDNYYGISYKLVDAAGTVYYTGTVHFPTLKSGERFENIRESIYDVPEGNYYLILSDYSN